MLPFSKTVSLYIMSSNNRNLFAIPSRMENVFASKLQADDLGEDSGSMSENEKRAVEIWNESPAIEETLRYVTNILAQHVNSKIEEIAHYTELKNSEKLVLYNHQSPQLQRILKLLPYSVAATPKLLMPEALITTVVELVKQGQVLKSNINPETPVIVVRKR